MSQQQLNQAFTELSLLDGGSSSTAAPAAPTTVTDPAPAPGNAGQSLSVQARELLQSQQAVVAKLHETEKALIDRGSVNQIKEYLSYLSQLNRAMDDIDKKY